MEFKSQLSGLSKKIKKARNISFIINEIVNLTIKIDFKLSSINIRFYLKFRMPIMHRQLFGKISQNPEYVNPHCIDINIPFHFECRKGISQNTS